MQLGFLYKFIICGLIILSAEYISAQILNRLDPDLIIDRSKGILVITPCASGSVFLNNYYLTKISAKDSVYFFNMNPGNYVVKFTSDSTSYIRNILIEKDKVLTIDPCLDPATYWNSAGWDTVAGKMTGKTYYSVKRAHFYNITQFAIFNFLIDDVDPQVSFFRSITTINGYQVTPGFCIGLGVSYNFYPYKSAISYEYIEEGNYQFLPVFLDIRAHLPQNPRRVAPFFKFDIGYNFLLEKSFINGYLYGPDYEMNKGGIYFSPGFGLRIFITSLVQVTASIEYSYERSELFVIYDQTQERYPSSNKFNLLKISLGVSFQYK